MEGECYRHLLAFVKRGRRPPAGAYNASLLMGTLPVDYDVNRVYAKLTHLF